MPGAVTLLGSTGCAQEGRSIWTPLNRSLARREYDAGRADLAANRRAAAQAHFWRAVSHDESLAEAHYELGRLLRDDGKLEVAADQFAAAVRHGPGNADYAIILGDTLEQVALTAIDRPRVLISAARSYRHALSLNPAQPDVFLAMARCVTDGGDLKAAIKSLEIARRYNPTSAGLVERQAQLLAQAGDITGALGAYEEAIRLSPRNPALHRACGEINLLLSREDPADLVVRQRAAAHLRRSLELDENQPDVRTELSLIDGQAAGPSRLTNEPQS